ncbi:MAG: hypothetical protein R3B70_07385 [Polyangiaceae bacterium]
MANLLSIELLRELCTAAVNAGLKREGLLANIHPGIVGGLHNTSAGMAQLMTDLSSFNRMGQVRDGTIPLRTWVENGLSLTEHLPEGEVFERALALLPKGEGKVQPKPISPIAVIDPGGKKGKKVVLFLTANPAESTRLELDEELREVRKSLLSATHRDSIHVEHAGAVRPTDLPELLVRVTPAIVHFSGHGSTIGELWFHDDTGGVAPVQPRLLGRIFGALDDSPVFGVVLNACYAAAQADEILPHVDFVIGMSTAIKDSAARQFSATFYQMLAFGKSVQTAFDLACAQIDLAKLDQADVPQLLVRDGRDAKKLYLIPRS